MRNLRGTNDRGDFDKDMLAEIFQAIKCEEIVMPAEHTGLVKENYLWKCVMKQSRGAPDPETGVVSSRTGKLLLPNVMFDHDLFSLIWGPTIAALSYVFDKTSVDDPNADSGGPDVIDRTIKGFQKCAGIAAHYRMSDVVDNLVISLAKFTTLQKPAQSSGPHLFASAFGSNTKAMLATRMIFSLIHKHGDFLRDGWKNVTDCLVQVWSLTQFYSVDFSKSRIGVKKCVFNKRTIKVCVSCC